MEQDDLVKRTELSEQGGAMVQNEVPINGAVESDITKNDVVRNDTVNTEEMMSQPSEIEKKNNNLGKKLALILTLSLLVVGVVVAAFLLWPKMNDGSVVGKWACYKLSWSSNQLSDEPVNELVLNVDGSFVYGPYGDTKNNHFAGNYTVSKEDKEASNGYEYYEVEFGPTKEYYLDGVAQDTTGRQMGSMEMGVKNGIQGREATVIFEHNYNMYSCLAE